MLVFSKVILEESCGKNWLIWGYIKTKKTGNNNPGKKRWGSGNEGWVFRQDMIKTQIASKKKDQTEWLTGHERHREWKSKDTPWFLA